MTDYVIYNGELYHYGVPGMKWGVHRYTTSSGTLSRAGQKKLTSMSNRVARKQLKNDKLTLKANKFDKKAAVATAAKTEATAVVVAAAVISVTPT